MSPKENVVMRLVGLFIFLAPAHGVSLLADIHIATAKRVAQEKRQLA